MVNKQMASPTASPIVDEFSFVGEKDSLVLESYKMS